MNINEYIEITENLMNEYNIQIRDTWTELKGQEVSKIYKGFSNELKIEYKDINGAQFKEGIVEWNIPDYKGCLYATPKIEISENCNCKHVVIHEIVHFLQYIIEEENKNYITGGFKYVTQRIEKEAYFIQLVFMSIYESELISEFLRNKNTEISFEMIKQININSVNIDGMLLELYHKGLFNFDS